MNSFIENLNAWGRDLPGIGWAILWQSSLLIVLLLAGDLFFGRKVRPAIRYALWLVALLKLALPPSLALPTSVAWWVRPGVHESRPLYRPVKVTYGPATTSVMVEPAVASPRSKPTLSFGGGALAGSGAITITLLIYLLWRWREVAREAVAISETPDWLQNVLNESRAAAGLRRPVPLRLVRGPVSPALFGLIRPIILLPESLARLLSSIQLRSVLLHELIHLRRRDVWVNCFQALLQSIYWWHPLVWIANSRIRRVREEAVDEGVMLALRGEAENYAPTLLEVARLGLAGPTAGLGLVGILESRGALHGRIERLADFRPPRRAGVTFLSVLCGVLFGTLGLPMGQAPAKNTPPDPDTAVNIGTNQGALGFDWYLGNVLMSGGKLGVQAGTAPAFEGAPNPAKPLGSSFVGTGGLAASDQIPVVDAEKEVAAKALVQDGKLFYEMGKLDEAEQKFTLALKENVREQAAYYYLSLIKEARAKKQFGLRNVSPGRQKIFRKLDEIKLDSMAFNNVSLGEVTKMLANESKLRDPDGNGINFVISQAQPDRDSSQLGNVTIWIEPQLTNIRLVDALDAVVKTASKPIKYAIEDYAVVFSLKSKNEPIPLYTRLMKVDPNAFESGLRRAVGKPATGLRQDTATLLREFLTSLNVDLSPPKTIFFNDRQSTVLIRASLQDLDVIESVVQVLNMTQPQLNIKARFIELPESEAASFWNSHPLQSQGSSVQSVQMTAEEGKRQLESWRNNQEIELLTESSVTTLSGRQSEIQIVDLKSVGVFTNWPSDHWVTNEVPVGPMLDVLPTLSTDTLRMDLAMMASVNKFLGYETLQQGEPPTPQFQSWRLPLTTTVWDGHTLIIGGAVDENGRSVEKAGEKRLLVVVTPTAINAAGNRVHTDAQVESAKQGR
jgi:Zn-dependent protease with chaperone function/tetratricopeptide (TPR) repeat protein